MEKCWIGLQGERGGSIKTCTCHSNGGIDKVGRYLTSHFPRRGSQKEVERLKLVIEMIDIVAKPSKFLKYVNGLELAGAEHEKSETNKEFKDFDAFSAAFFKDPSIDYAYLYVACRIRENPNSHIWLCLTKIPFDLDEVVGFIPLSELVKKGVERW